MPLPKNATPSRHKFIEVPSVKDRYNEIFDVEVESWCYGLGNFPGELTPALVHRVMKEFAKTFEEAINHNLIFNLVEIAKSVRVAVRNLVDEHELAYSMLAQLPAPYKLNEDQQFVIGQVIDIVEQSFPGALERLEKRWRFEREKGQQHQARRIHTSAPARQAA